MIIGIGGPSNSGKSKLAKELKNALDTYTVDILCQDDFVYPKNLIPKVKDHIDWDTPLSIDFTSFKKAIIRSAENHEVSIAEGFLIFYSHEIRQIIDKKIFIELDKNEFYRRKKHDLRWGTEPQWYIDHIWSSYLKYGTISREEKETAIVLDGEKLPDAEDILSLIGL